MVLEIDDALHRGGIGLVLLQEIGDLLVNGDEAARGDNLVPSF